MISEIHYTLEARYRGATVVAILPDKNPSAQFADMWLPINWSADPALWLCVAKILIDRGGIETEVVKEQNDAPGLVRFDNGAFLRESDLREGGDAEQFFVLDSASGELEPLPKGTLAMACDYALEAELNVTLKDGRQLAVTNVFSLLKRRVAEYTPEKVQEISGIHPEQIGRASC